MIMIDCQLPDKVCLSGTELAVGWCDQGGSVGKVRLELGFEGWEGLGEVRTEEKGRKA